MGWIIKRAMTFLEEVHSINEQDSLVHELDCQRKAIHLRWPGLFGGAQFKSFQRRNNDLRLPSALLNPADVERLSNFNIESIFHQTQLIQETGLDKAKYFKLRNLMVCCLTLENGRRGEESSR